tara:strand:+ start:649 stop:1887 length:1239 start_codon:yes stop_codon:yes gene_type:complete
MPEQQTQPEPEQQNQPRQTEQSEPEQPEVQEREDLAEDGLARGYILLITFLVEAILLYASIHLFSLGFVYGILGLVVTIGVFGLLIFNWWAPNNLYFTIIPERTCKNVLKAGGYNRTLIQCEGFTLNSQQNVVSVNARNKKQSHIFGGFAYYGFWPFYDIETHLFSWTAVLQNQDFEERPEELFDHYLLKDDVYGFVVESAEDKDLIPLEVKCVLTGRIVNARKISLVSQDWLELIISRMVPWVRNAITQKTFRKLISDKRSIGEEITKVFEKEKRICRNRYGFEIIALEIIDIDPKEEYRKLTTAPADARRKAEEKVELAKGEAKEIKILAEARAKEVGISAEAEVGRLEKVYGEIADHGEVGKLARYLEALEKTPGEGSKVVVMPGVDNMLPRVVEAIAGRPSDPEPPPS